MKKKEKTSIFVKREVLTTGIRQFCIYFFTLRINIRIRMTYPLIAYLAYGRRIWWRFCFKSNKNRKKLDERHSECLSMRHQDWKSKSKSRSRNRIWNPNDGNNWNGHVLIRSSERNFICNIQTEMTNNICGVFGQTNNKWIEIEPHISK